MLYPEGRTDAYTIIELTMIEGRSIDAQKHPTGASVACMAMK